MNKHPHIEKIFQDPQFERLQNWCDIGPVQTATLESFTQQVVGETILAILSTDTRSLVYTTFDKGLVDSTISRVVDQVREHWKTQ